MPPSALTTNTSRELELRETAVTGAPGAALPSATGDQASQCVCRDAVTMAPFEPTAKRSMCPALRETALRWALGGSSRSSTLAHGCQAPFATDRSHAAHPTWP